MHHERVIVEPALPRRNQVVDIKYQGLLAQSGADAIWLHYGFDGWKTPETIAMQQGGNQFTCGIKASGSKEMNFCFKDSANHWDNNDGWNWSCPIR